MLPGPLHAALGDTKMNAILAICFCLALTLTAATGGLMLAPPMRIELIIWRRLGVQRLRHWLTQRRRIEEPLDLCATRRIAYRNLRWHLFLTGLFSGMLAAAVTSESRILQSLTALLVFPCVAYFAGSMVQRQKLVLLHFLVKAPNWSR